MVNGYLDEVMGRTDKRVCRGGGGRKRPAPMDDDRDRIPTDRTALLQWALDAEQPPQAPPPGGPSATPEDPPVDDNDGDTLTVKKLALFDEQDLLRESMLLEKDEDNQPPPVDAEEDESTDPCLSHFDDKTFVDKLGARDLIVKPVQDQCFFRALSHQIYLKEDQATALRAKCCAHLHTHRERFGALHPHVSIESHILSLQANGRAEALDVAAMEEVMDRNIALYSIQSATPTRPATAGEQLKRVPCISLSLHGLGRYGSVFDMRNPPPLRMRPSQTLLTQRMLAFDPQATPPARDDPTKKPTPPPAGPAARPPARHHRDEDVFNTRPSSALALPVRTVSPFRTAGQAFDVALDVSDATPLLAPAIQFAYQRHNSVIFDNHVHEQYKNKCNASAFDAAVEDFDSFRRRLVAEKNRSNLRFLREMYKALGGLENVEAACKAKRAALLDAEVTALGGGSASRSAVARVLAEMRADLDMPEYARRVEALMAARLGQTLMPRGDMMRIVAEAEAREDQQLALRLQAYAPRNPAWRQPPASPSGKRRAEVPPPYIIKVAADSSALRSALKHLLLAVCSCAAVGGLDVADNREALYLGRRTQAIDTFNVTVATVASGLAMAVLMLMLGRAWRRARRHGGTRAGLLAVLYWLAVGAAAGGFYWVQLRSAILPALSILPPSQSPVPVPLRSPQGAAAAAPAEAAEGGVEAIDNYFTASALRAVEGLEVLRNLSTRGFVLDAFLGAGALAEQLSLSEFPAAEGPTDVMRLVREPLELVEREGRRLLGAAVSPRRVVEALAAIEGLKSDAPALERFASLGGMLVQHLDSSLLELTRAVRQRDFGAAEALWRTLRTQETRDCDGVVPMSLNESLNAFALALRGDAEVQQRAFDQVAASALRRPQELAGLFIDAQAVAGFTTHDVTVLRRAWASTDRWVLQVELRLVRHSFMPSTAMALPVPSSIAVTGLCEGAETQFWLGLHGQLKVVGLRTGDGEQVLLAPNQRRHLASGPGGRQLHLASSRQAAALVLRVMDREGGAEVGDEAEGRPLGLQEWRLLAEQSGALAAAVCQPQVPSEPTGVEVLVSARLQ